MTRPNCSRTFAYSLAMVTQVAAPPVASAAARSRPSTTAVRARAGEDAIGGRVGGEGHRADASGRVGVRRHRDGDLVAGGDHEVVAAREEEQVGEPGPEHQVGGVVEPHRGAGRAVGEAGQVRTLLGVAAGGGDHRRGPDRRQEGTRARPPRPAPRPRSPARRDRTRTRRAPPAGAGRASRGRPSPSTTAGSVSSGASSSDRASARAPVRSRNACGDAGEFEVILGDRDTHESLPGSFVVNLSVGLSTVTGDGSNRPTAAGRQAGAGGMLVPGDERNRHVHDLQRG